jgi:hypothetical protein
MLEYDDLELRSWLAALDADPHVEWVDAQRGRLAASWESRTIAAPLPAAVQFSTISEPVVSRTTRSRRYRRLRIAAAAAAVLALVVVVAVALSAVDRRSVQTPLRPVPTPPASTVAPLVKGPDAASTLLASWGWWAVPALASSPHIGNVFVYADGRVIWDQAAYVDADGRVTAIPVDPIGGNPGVARLWLTESGVERGVIPGGPPAFFPEGEYRDAILERRLSARGLALVRAGKLDPRYFLVNWNVDRDGQLHRVRYHYQRRELWAEPTGRVWEPSKYAVCPSAVVGGPPGTADAVAQLPAPAQALLNGKQHTYDPNTGTANSGGPSGPPMECFELTAAEFSTLQELMPPSVNNGSPFAAAWPLVVEGEYVEFLNVLPIYPHGQPVPWGR